MKGEDDCFDFLICSQGFEGVSWVDDLLVYAGNQQFIVWYGFFFREQTGAGLALRVFLYGYDRWIGAVLLSFSLEGILMEEAFSAQENIFGCIWK